MRFRNLHSDISKQGLVFTRPWLGIMFPDPDTEHRSSSIISSSPWLERSWSLTGLTFPLQSWERSPPLLTGFKADTVFSFLSTNEIYRWRWWRRTEKLLISSHIYSVDDMFRNNSQFHFQVNITTGLRQTQRDVTNLTEITSYKYYIVLVRARPIIGFAD